MMRNGMFAAVVVLVLAAGGYLYFSGYRLGGLGGTGTGAAPQEHTLQYSSREGYSFAYPDTYELSSRAKTAGTEVWNMVTLVPRGYVPPQNGEGPPSITVGSYSNAEGLPLEQFLRSEPKANFSLSDQTLRRTTVGGKPALAYTYSGLYESDAVAVAANGKVYVFAAGWMQEKDKIRTDLQDIIKTVTFN